HQEEASFIPQTKYKLIHDAALEACDARDAVKDGVIENPAQCRFDPAVLQCKAGDAATCLTSTQVEAARKIYAPATNPRTREVKWDGRAWPVHNRFRSRPITSNTSCSTIRAGITRS